jgi:hypothetical protein
MTGKSRADLLELLIACGAPIDEIVRELGAFSWDSDRELVVLKRTDVLSMLERYLHQEIRSADIEAWANAIEGREDIGYEVGAEKQLAGAVFELANPELTQTLTADVATKWIERLRHS